MLWVFLLPCLLFAQLDSKIRHHVILAFDNAGYNINSSLNVPAAQNPKILRQLNRILLDGDSQIPPYFRDGDLFSAISFSLGAAEDMDKFVTVLSTPNGKQLKYSTPDKDEMRNAILHTQWNYLATQGIKKSDSFSMLSLSRPYSLLALGSDEATALNNRTFLVIVTDDHYNGNNSDKEVKDVNACQDKTKKLDVNSIMELCSNIQENYQFKYIQKYDCTERGKLLSAIVFEILPLQRYFTIETALEYPSAVKAKRVAKGGYEIEFECQDRNHPNYKVRKTVVTLQNEKGAVDSVTLMPDGKAFFHIKESTIPVNTSLQLQSWVNIKDGFYDSMVMSAYGDETHASRGLVRQLKIEFEETASVFKAMPFLWFFCDDDQEKAALIWRCIGVALLCIIFFCIAVVNISKQYNQRFFDEKHIHLK